MLKVNRYTRSGKNGKAIYCPICEKEIKAYHFSWDALQCIHCLSIVLKTDWNLDIKNKESLNE